MSEKKTSFAGVAAPEEATDPPPAQPWKRTLGALLIAQFVSILGFSLVQPFLPFYVQELGVEGDAQVALWSGIVIGAMNISFGSMAPVWGSLADRYGRKMMVGRSMLGGMVSMVLMGMCRNVYQLVAVRVLQGALTGTVTATNTLVSSVVPRRRMGYSLGLNQTMVVLGLSLGPWIGGFLAEYWGLRTSCFVSAGILLIAGAVAMLGAQERFQVAPESRPGSGIGMRQAFGGRGLLAIMAALFFIALSTSFAGPVFPLLVEKIAGPARAASATGMLLGVGGLAAGLAAAVLGRIGDRIGHRKLLMGMTAAAGVLTVPHAFVQTLMQLVPVRLSLGAAAGGIQPTINAFISTSVSSDMIGRAYGITRTANALGFAIGPILCGLMASMLGLRLPFVIMGVLLLISSGVVARFVKPPNGGE